MLLTDQKVGAISRKKFVDEYLYERLFLAAKPFTSAILRSLAVSRRKSMSGYLLEKALEAGRISEHGHQSNHININMGEENCMPIEKKLLQQGKLPSRYLLSFVLISSPLLSLVLFSSNLFSSPLSFPLIG